ncbi:hypothetical protein [Nocardioides sp.]|uniref:hypothetical protein n=1 Tax=Nocardioides sp. TaxID=35761 RepID=UPI002D7FAA36|nr:hypothetical protein [Nocardioides sp.]HET8961411.1 hypothetical protein [Nocardioides sp.]
MDRLRIDQVDERDSNWEDSSPRFRVYLHGSGERGTSGWTDTYDVVGADILQVIDWAQRQAAGSLTYAVALVCDDQGPRREPGRGRGLVWLVGMDGNDPPGDMGEEMTQRRMLARRAQPVVVPEADRMPAGVPDPYDEGGRAR